MINIVMRKGKRLKYLIIFSFSCFIFSIANATPAFQDIERKLLVLADKTPIFLKPDPASPIVGIVPQKTILTSYKNENDWYRVVLPPDRDNVSIIGYIAAKDVTVVEEITTAKPDFWGLGEGKVFKGIGLEVQVGAGYAFFGGGDFPGSVRGMYEELAASIAALGYPVIERKVQPFHSGVHFSTDLALRLSPRFSVGLGGEYLYARNDDSFGFFEGVHYQTAISEPTIQAIIIRPCIYLTFPLSHLISVRLDGGPALFVTKYEYSRSAAATVFGEYLHQEAKDVALGVQAGVGLELNLNERVGLFLRTSGRFARVASFEGDEQYDLSEGIIDIPGPRYDGALYFLHRGSFAALTVRPDAPSPDARRAVFDFAGLDFSLGLRMKF
jgi:hypothetical protein